MKLQPGAAAWMGGAFCAALCLGALVIAVDGADRKGIDAALFVTGRLNFLLFWPAYAGSALVSLFGDSFSPLRRRGREFGLAFASALLVHLGFVAWLCAIGDAPERSTFIFFGVATAFVYMIALFSIRRLQLALGDRGWRLLRTIGMNYIAYTFAVDFLDDPLGGGFKHVLTYLPFAILAVAGPALRFAAFVRGFSATWGVAQQAPAGPGDRPNLDEA